MKWRHALLYLLVLVLLGGYYYYFEIVMKRERDEAEQIKKKVFAVSAEAVEEVYLEVEGKPTVHLVKKDGAWVLDQPVSAEADQGAVKTLVHSLVELEKSRDVDTDAKDMELYGLAKPGQEVRFLSENTWHRLRLGSKNPTGESHYAAREDENVVFLVASGQVQALNKAPEDLRRRDLLNFEDENVQNLVVSWADGHQVKLVREAKNKDAWRCADEPERRVKKSKVDNVLNQIRWLRAKNFLEGTGEGSALLEGGVSEAQVVLQGFDGSELSLQIGRKKGEPETYVALSSQLKTPVTVDGAVLKELPKSVRDVEDRSVARFDSKDITRMEYAMGEEKGEMILQDDGTWVQVKADGSRRVFKESWRIRPLFWEWEDLEYEEAEDAEGQCGQQAGWHRMSLYRKEGDPLVFSWPGASEDQKTDTVRLCSGSGKAYLVETEKLKKIEKKLQEVLKSPSEEKTSK
ncbi:DUF4340 domain-containing protein [Desulfosoma caldarium]|uniref:Uncharacterized protein DUF4340 n=1 Tax=Desulfosoma caldarium TaxID=610254 RepID=A0A3N1UHY4_9BACT|nr:DUF4340 domain-containing protein [Desulfosoma caldarium]ROQ90872.1 uncharacterized protein DUF4340 [Desulfosoma caldarium]